MLIVPGRVLRLFCSFTDRIIEVVKESMTLEGGIARIIVKNLTGT